MRLESSAEYPATPTVVVAIMTDPAFVAHKAEQMSVSTHSAEVRTDGDHRVVHSTRTLPTAEMPDVARRFVGEVLTLVEEQAWGPVQPDGSHVGSIRLTVVGAPVSVVGTMHLRPGGQGAIHQLEAELSAKVPLLGSSIERAAAPAISAGIEVEAAMVTAWLSR